MTPANSEPLQPDSVAPAVPVTPSVTGERSVVTTLPVASSTASTGWVVSSAPAAPPTSVVVKTIWKAGPAVLTLPDELLRGELTTKLFVKTWLFESWVSVIVISCGWLAAHVLVKVSDDLFQYCTALVEANAAVY